MKLYAFKHLDRIGLFDYARKNLQRVYENGRRPKRPDADLYYIPTPEFDILVKKYNVIAALKGIKICKPVYKHTYKEKDGSIVW